MLVKLVVEVKEEIGLLKKLITREPAVGLEICNHFTKDGLSDFSALRKRLDLLEEELWIEIWIFWNGQDVLSSDSANGDFQNGKVNSPKEIQELYKGQGAELRSLRGRERLCISEIEVVGMEGCPGIYEISREKRRDVALRLG